MLIVDEEPGNISLTNIELNLEGGVKWTVALLLSWENVGQAWNHLADLRDRGTADRWSLLVLVQANSLRFRGVDASQIGSTGLDSES